MSRLKFKDDIYTLAELIKLRSLSKLYKEGEVMDEENGNSLDISEIDSLREFYFDELMGVGEKSKMIREQKKKETEKSLEDKFLNKTIKPDELLLLIKMTKSRPFQVSYDNYMNVNLDKPKPNELNFTDYGKFMGLLDLMSYSNRIKNHKKDVEFKESFLINKLDFTNIRGLNSFLARLKKVSLIAHSGHGKNKFIHINPTYAKRKIIIDITIYNLFEEDLREYLNEYEVRYFELVNQGACTISTIKIIKD